MKKKINLSNDYLKNNINKIQIDEFGRPHGILSVYKPVGMSSHDIVNIVRKKYQTKKVGHAGALDVFACGICLILVGSLTKASDQLLNLDKKYNAEIVLGVQTETQDTEGEILSENLIEVEKDKIVETLISFLGKQKQFVSAYSSVKVMGNKLRVLMRDKRYFKEILVLDNKKIIFKPKNPGLETFEVLVPSKEIEIFNINLASVNLRNVEELKNFKNLKFNRYQTVTVNIHCSKGTYVRQFAEDFAERINTVGCLYFLERYELGPLQLDSALTLDKLELQNS